MGAFLINVPHNFLIYNECQLRGEEKNRSLFLCLLFAVNFHAFNFELEEVWGHFWIALETSYLKMPLNFPWLKIKGMKMDSKKRQQIRIIMRQSLVQR